MSSLHWMKIFPRETLSDANFAGWSLEERGAWLTLVLHAWVEGSLPSDETSLARLLHVDHGTMRGLWSALGSRFIPHPDKPGRITSPRLEKEREAAMALAEKRGTAGRAGATSRWDKEKRKHGKRIRLPDESQGHRTDAASDSHAGSGIRQQDQAQDQDSGTDSLWLAGIAQKVASALGQPKVGLGDRSRRQEVEASIRRVVDFVGEDVATQAMAHVIRQHLGGQISALTALPGFLDRIPDAEWRRVAGSQP
jgi:uncharacterized protein YdaU (DUF1376 family)